MIPTRSFKAISDRLMIVGVTSVVLCLMAWVLSVIWGEAIPALLPGLVDAGCVSGSLTFIQAFWVVLLIVFLRSLTINQSAKEKRWGL